MASPSPTKTENSFLEGISDDEEEVAQLNSEHEEGEISSEGDDGNGGEEGEISSPSLSSVCSNSRRPIHRPPDHYSPQPLRRTLSVTSEVVIYDDLGRTAIYTSPHQTKSIVHSKIDYPRGPEAGKKWTNEREENSRRDRVISKREKEDTNNKRDRSSSTKCKEDDWERRQRAHKESKHKAESSKRTKGKESRGACASTCELPSHKAKRRCPPKCPRNKVITLSDTSSVSSHSCSSSSDEDDENTSSSPKTIRGKGKENKLSKDSDESLEYGPKRPPPKSIITRLPLHHKSAAKTKPTLTPPSKSRPTLKKPAQKISPQRYVPKSKMSYVPPQKYAPKPKNSYFSPKKYPPKSKGSYDDKSRSKTDEIKWETIRELALPLLKGQKHPPPGSIGEMLLKKKILETLRNQSKGGAASDQPAATNDNTAEAKTGVESKESSENQNPNTAQEGCTLDQEDEDELQLRLLALQSSLRFLSDIRKEGQKEGEAVLAIPSSNAISINILEGIKLPSDPQCSQVQLDINSLPVNAERTISTTPQEYEDFLPFVMRGSCLEIMGSSPASPAIPSPDLRELYEEEELVVNGVLNNSCKLIPLERDFNMYNIDKIRSNNVNKQTFGNDNPRLSDKEQQDSNQDPIDMDICDTSGEEDEGDSELLQIVDVGEDISLSNNNSPLHVQNPGYNMYSDQPSTANDGSSLNPDGSRGSFQIPVEWAYMMPPPPPPEEPDNNMETMNSFSYDQALYLQTMQGPYENNYDPNTPYQQQFTKEGGVDDKWEQQQEHHEPQLPQLVNSQWSSTNTETYTEDIPEPLNNTETYPSVPKDDMLETIPSIGKETSQETPEVLKDLKNSPAEQYQAFMLVMMNQQNPQLSKKSRNLIEVPLIKPDGSYEGKTNLGQVVNKKAEGKRRRELRRQMRRLLENKKLEYKKKMGEKNSVQKLPPSQEADYSDAEPDNLSSAEAIQDLPSHTVGSEGGAEEEDEDLLRAQLLIDMSLRKHQKEAKQDSSAVAKQGPIAGSSFMTHKPRASDRRVPPIPRIATKNAPYSLPGSSKPLPVIKTPQVAKLFSVSKPLPLTKLHVSHASLHKKRIIKKSRNDKGIQSRGFPAEGRTSLSDIGGFGLDPKSSQFYYQGSGDSSSLLESQKIKFPPIKPVIINLNSDSEEEGELPNQIEPPVKTSIEPTIAQKESEPVPASSGLLSQSLDMLLKSLRNTKPTDMKGKKQVAQVTNTPEAKPHHSDLTPQVVRHLSRPQQVEYRLLKEEIRKKEILRQKKMQQKKQPVAITTGSLKSPIASTSGSGINVKNAATITAAGMSSSETTQDRGKSMLAREVSWQEMGRLKIQLSNIASALDKRSAVTASMMRQKLKEGKPPLPLQLDTMENSSLEGTPLEGSPRNTPIYDEGSPRNTSVYDEGLPRNTSVYDEGSPRNTSVYDEGSPRNTPINDDRSPRNTPDYDESPRNTPVDDEEDEEMLRLMVLHTLNKNKSERKAVTVKERRVTLEDSPNAYESPVPETDDSIDLGTPPASLKVVIHQKTHDKEPEEQGNSVDYQQNTSTREVVISDKVETEGDGQGECPVLMDESLAGEWMVLDQVHDSEDSVEENNAQICKVMSEEEERLHQEGLEEDYGVSKESKHEVVNTSQDKSTGGSDSSAEEVQERNFTSTNSALEPVNCEISVGERSDTNDADKPGECTKDICVSNCTCVKGQILTKNIAKPSGESQTVPASSQKKCVQRSKTKKKVLPQTVHSKISGVQLRKGVDNVSTDCQLVNEKPAQKSCNSESDTEKKGLSKTIKKSIVSETRKTNNSESNDKSDSDTRQKLASESSEKSDSETRKKIASESGEKNNAELNKFSTNNKTAPASEGNTAGKNDDEQDKKLKLKNVERAYIAKRGQMNQVISQLDTLVQEATQEEEQRQGLRKTVADLRTHLATLENQLETKGVALKTKMEKVRRFHKQILTDRQAISKLQKRGEQLGCQVHGSKYILPKLLLSPHSKTKDTHVKQALASSIDALRRVRDVNTASVSPSASSASTPATTVFPSMSSASLSVPSTSSSIKSSTSTTASPSSNASASKVIRQLETYFAKEGSASLTQAIRSSTSTKNNVSLSTIQTTDKHQSTTLSQKVARTVQSTALSKQVASTIQSIGKSSVALSQKVAKTVQAKINLPNTLSQKVLGKVSVVPSDAGKVSVSSSAVVGGKGVAVKRKSGAPDTRPVGVKAARTETSHTSVNHTQGTADNKKEKGGSLDEMSELCPHDLLGRCNDDACIYQHLTQRRPDLNPPDPLQHQPNQPPLCTNSSCVNLSPKAVVPGPRVSAVGTKPVVSKGVGMVKAVTVSQTVGANGAGITKATNVTQNVVGTEVVAKGVTVTQIAIVNAVTKNVGRGRGVRTANSTSTTRNVGRGKGIGVEKPCSKTLSGKTKVDVTAQGNLEAGIVAPGLDGSENVLVALESDSELLSKKLGETVIVGQKSFLSLQTDNFHNTDTVPSKSISEVANKVPSKDSFPVKSSPSPKIGNDLETVPPVTSKPSEDTTVDNSLKRESEKAQDKLSDVHSRSLDNVATSDIEDNVQATSGHNENGSLVDVLKSASKGAEVCNQENLECTVIDCNSQVTSGSSQQDEHRLEENCPKDDLETHLINTVSDRVPPINIEPEGMEIADEGVPVPIKIKENDDEPEEMDRTDKEEYKNALNAAEKITGENDGTKRGTRLRRRAVVAKISSSTGQVITTTKRSLSAEMGQKPKRNRVRRRRSASSVSDGERSGQAVIISCPTSPSSTLTPTPISTPSSTHIPTPIPIPTPSSTRIPTPTTHASLITPKPSSAPTSASNLEAEADLACSIDQVVSSAQGNLDTPIVTRKQKIKHRQRLKLAMEAGNCVPEVVKEIVGNDDISIVWSDPTSAPSSHVPTSAATSTLPSVEADLAFSIGQAVSSAQGMLSTPIFKRKRNMRRRQRLKLAILDMEAGSCVPEVVEEIVGDDDISIVWPDPTSAPSFPSSHAPTPAATSTLPSAKADLVFSIDQAVSSAQGNLNTPIVKRKRKMSHKQKFKLAKLAMEAGRCVPKVVGDGDISIVGPDPTSAPSSHVPTPAATSTLPSAEADMAFSIGQAVYSAQGNLNTPIVKRKRKRRHGKRVKIDNEAGSSGPDVVENIHDNDTCIVWPDPTSTLRSVPSSPVPTPASSAPISTPTSTLPSSTPTPIPASIPTSTRCLRTRQRGKKM